MLTIQITIEEESAQRPGPARRVRQKVRCFGFATQAENEAAEHWKPFIQQLMGTPYIDRTKDGSRGN